MTEHNICNVDFLSLWEGADIVLPGDQKAKA